MHGETLDWVPSALSIEGLSPHARGNRSFPSRSSHLRGTIPACTGKPSRSASTTSNARDYPRMHGETSGCDPEELREQGLSPHARGNQRLAQHFPDVGGTIPACTGKPPIPRWL